MFANIRRQSIHEISFADFGQRFLAIHLHIP